MIRKIWVCTLDVIMCDFELEHVIFLPWKQFKFCTQQREVRSDSSTNVNFTG